MFISIFNTVLAQAEKPTSSPDSSMFLMMIVVIGFLFYFIILRPQKKERQEQKEKLNAIIKGDRIVTVGGIHGKVVDVNSNENKITLEVAKNVRMVFSKNAVGNIVKKSDSQQQTQQEEK